MKVSRKFFTCVLWILSLILDLGLCAPHFMRSIVIHNLLCPSGADINFGQLCSDLQCAQKCYNDVNCQGFFYKLSGTCLGTTVNVSSPLGCLLETGTKYYFATGEFFFYFAACHMSHIVRKPVFGVPSQVRHKPECTAG